ncbi:MAG: VOC family protein [Myxococcota bacterium]
MIRKELDHVSLSVSDFERARHFYEEVLGLEPDDRRPDFGFPGGWYKVGDSQIHLIQELESVDVGSRASKLNPTAPHLALRIDDYDETLAYLKALGLEVFETRAEIGQMWIRDPDHNIIELTAAVRSKE